MSLTLQKLSTYFDMYIYIYILRIGGCLPDYVLVLDSEMGVSVVTSHG